jgi:nucleoside-diphosphate-sugar epimerase
MKVLVTGANSPLGTVVIKEAILAKHCVIGAVREDRNNLDTSLTSERIILDLSKPETFSAIPNGVECVVHIAAANEGTPGYLLDINGIGTLRLIQSAICKGVAKIIHVSSMSVYGTVKESIVRAGTPIQHSSPYGLSKWAGECFLNEFSTRVASVSIRAPAIIGNGASRNFIARLVSDMLQSRDELVLKNPEFLFNNVIHYETFARFIISLIESDLNSFDYFPVASSDPLPLADVVQHIASRLDYAGRISWGVGELSPFSIGTEDAENFGFKPRPVLEELDAWLNSDSLTLTNRLDKSRNDRIS